MITTIDTGRKLRHYKAINTPLKEYNKPLSGHRPSQWEFLMRFGYSWAVGLVAIINPAMAEGISGTYVGAGSNSAFLIQLVETTGGQLTGRYEQTVRQPDGNLDQMNASIVGASDGRTVVLTIKPTELLSGSITASGTAKASQLHLSGSGDGRKINLNLEQIPLGLNREGFPTVCQ
jgi:hypothetical protein